MNSTAFLSFLKQIINQNHFSEGNSHPASSSHAELSAAQLSSQHSCRGTECIQLAQPAFLFIHGSYSLLFLPLILLQHHLSLHILPIPFIPIALPFMFSCFCLIQILARHSSRKYKLKKIPDTLLKLQLPDKKNLRS